MDEMENDQGLTFQGTLLDSAGKEHFLAFTRSSAGRYEANIPIAGSLFGKIFRLKNGAIQEAAIVQYSSPGSRESDLSADGRARLMQLTGNVIQSPDQLRPGNKTATDIQPLRKRLLLLAIWLFVFDVAARKIDFRMFRRKKPAQAVPVGVNIPLEKLKIRKLEIEKTRPVWVELENASSGEPLQDVQPEPRATPPERSEYMERLKEAKRRR